MATGGKPQHVKGSDEFHLFECSHCDRKQRNKVAEIYCIQCEEYFCERCLGKHNSFAKMATHAMLDRRQIEAKGPQPVYPLLLVPCERHKGQVYTIFCENHDRVCCGLCVTTQHQTCTFRYIVKVAHGTVRSGEMDELKQAVKDIQTDVKKVREKMNMDIQRLVDEKDMEIYKIQEEIKLAMNMMKMFEKHAIEDVNRKFTEFKYEIESDRNLVDTIVKTLYRKMDKLEKADNEAAKFVYMKLCKERESTYKHLIHTFKPG